MAKQQIYCLCSECRKRHEDDKRSMNISSFPLYIFPSFFIVSFLVFSISNSTQSRPLVSLLLFFNRSERTKQEAREREPSQTSSSHYLTHPLKPPVSRAGGECMLEPMLTRSMKLSASDSPARVIKTDCRGILLSCCCGVRWQVSTGDSQQNISRCS